MPDAVDLWVKRTRGVFIAAVILVIAVLLGGATVSYLNWQEMSSAGAKADAQASRLPSLDQAAADADRFAQSSLDKLNFDQGTLTMELLLGDAAGVSGARDRISGDQSAYTNDLAAMAVAKAKALGARPVLAADRTAVAADTERLHSSLIWSGLALLLTVLLAVAAFLSSTKARATVALRREGIVPTSAV